jgi:hypothetical protein
VFNCLDDRYSVPCEDRCRDNTHSETARYRAVSNVRGRPATSYLIRTSSCNISWQFEAVDFKFCSLSLTLPSIYSSDHGYYYLRYQQGIATVECVMKILPSVLHHSGKMESLWIKPGQITTHQQQIDHFASQEETKDGPGKETGTRYYSHLRSY